jgi:hypothetical protein
MAFNYDFLADSELKGQFGSAILTILTILV